MIEIISDDQKEEEKWKLSINEQIVDGIEFSSLFVDLSLKVSLGKTSPIFFEQKVEDFISLQSEKLSNLEIVIDLRKEFEKEATDLFLNEFEEDNIFSTFNLKIMFAKNKEIFGSIVTGALMLNYFWKHPFSLIEYRNFIQDYIGSGFNPSKFEEFETTGGIIFPLFYKGLTILQVIDYSIEKFKVSHQKAFEELGKKANANSLTTRFFNFPDEVRIPCEQYLLYFTEFLRDLGISTTADITHEAGEILFSVTPTNPDLALDKIRVALEVFLDLPKSEIIIVPDEEFEIPMLKAKANIDHLNSQLSLAKAEIRVKQREIQAFEATLEAKDISIEFLREKLNQQKRLLNGEIAEGIIDIEPNPKEDKEEFFDGVFALTQYEEKGVRVNLAQLYRKLKAYLKGE